MKRRILTISLIVASLVLLVSVGFAGWVITSNHQDTKTGNFTAYEVSSNGALTVAICDVNGSTTGTPNNTIVYGKPNSTDQGTIEAKDGFSDPAWLTFAEMDEQVLVVYLKLSLSNATTSQTFTLTNSFKKNSSAQEVYNLIAAPTYAKVSGEGSISSNEVTLSNNQSIVVSVTYNWGSEFGGLNPYEYFNLQSQTDEVNGSINSVSYTTYETKANVALSQLDTLVDGLSYEIVIADKLSA